MASVVERFALRLKVHRIGGTIIHHVALLKRSLDQKGHKTRMIKGFCVIEETKEACEHYWLRDTDTGYDMDIGFAVATHRSPELKTLRPVLLETLPPGLTRSDEGDNQIVAENSRLYELYQADPKAFWTASPREISSFHPR